MFDLEYKGGGCIVVSTKKAKLFIDPNSANASGKAVAVKDGIELATERAFVLPSEEATLIVDGPGEYEVADFSIRGVATDKNGEAQGSNDMTVYRVEIGDVRIAVLGSTASELHESQLEALGVVDMAIITVGGDGLNVTQAAHLARTVDVKIAVPIDYDGTGEVATAFAKEFTAEVEQTGKYKVKASSSLPITPTVIDLSQV